MTILSESEAASVERTDLDTLVARILDPGTSKADLSVAIHSYDRIREIVWQNGLRRTKEKFPPDVLKRFARDAIEETLVSIRKMRDLEYSKNDDLRRNGYTFSQRKLHINGNKIDWCNAEEARLRAILESSLEVKPLEQWFDEVDLELARREGMRWVIRVKLDILF